MSDSDDPFAPGRPDMNRPDLQQLQERQERELRERQDRERSSESRREAFRGNPERVTLDSIYVSDAYRASLERIEIPDSDLARQLKGLISGTKEAWQLMASLKVGEGFVWAELSVVQRAQHMGAELMLSALYVIGFGWYAATHIGSLGHLGQVAGLIIPSAFAQGTTPAPWSIRVVILTLYSVAVVMVLLMSSYAAMLRKPPLTSAKDIQKIVLGFVTGQLTIAGFLN